MTCEMSIDNKAARPCIAWHENIIKAYNFREFDFTQAATNLSAPCELLRL